MAALLTIESQNTDKLAFYLGECRDLGVAGAAAGRQRQRAAVHGRAPRRGVRFGLAAIKNVGEGAILSMLGVAHGAAARSRRSMRSARTSTCAWSTSACSRAWSRPARSIRCTPRDANWTAQPATVRRARLFAADRSRARAGQPAPGRSRAGPVAAVRRRRRRRRATTLPALALPDATPWTEEEMLRGEKEALGLYLSGHPLARYAEASARRPARDEQRQLADRPGRRDGTMGGIVTGCRIVKTRKGDRMAVFMLEDQQRQRRGRGLPRAVQAVRVVHRERRMVLVTGRVEVDDERRQDARHRGQADLKTVTERLVKEVCVTMQAAAARPRRRSGRWPTCSRAIAATSASSSSCGSRRDARRGRCVVKADGAAGAACGRPDELVLAVERICGAGIGRAALVASAPDARSRTTDA